MLEVVRIRPIGRRLSACRICEAGCRGFGAFFSLALREADDLSLSPRDGMAERSGEYGPSKRVAILNYRAISTL